MDVPDDKVGQLIGRGGRRIIDLQRVSSTKIFVESTAGKDYRLRIEGGRDGMEIAKRMIGIQNYWKIDNNNNKPTLVRYLTLIFV